MLSSRSKFLHLGGGCCRLGGAFSITVVGVVALVELSPSMYAIDVAYIYTVGWFRINNTVRVVAWV